MQSIDNNLFLSTFQTKPIFNDSIFLSTSRCIESETIEPIE